MVGRHVDQDTRVNVYESASCLGHGGSDGILCLYDGACDNHPHVPNCRSIGHGQRVPAEGRGISEPRHTSCMGDCQFG
jgi:hypothetical protein